MLQRGYATKHWQPDLHQPARTPQFIQNLGTSENQSISQYNAINLPK